MLRYLIFFTTVSGLFAADPDFSGRWRLNESRSQIRALPLRPEPVLEIEHRDASVRCRGTFAPSADFRPCSFTVDGKETRETAAGWTHSSKAKWEGSALLRNTIVSSASRQHTEMDRWKLSRDGNVLTIRRVVVSAGGEMESVLVYERESAATPQP